MNIGYHYHVPYKKVGEKICLPSYFGLFIDELAQNVDHLYLFLFEQNNPESEIEDYTLTGANIKLVSLGSYPTFYHRLLYPFKFLKICKQYAPLLNHFIVRAPTPLSAYIYWATKKQTKVTLMIVGDYIKSLPGLEQPLYRKVPIVILMYFYQYLHLKTVKNANVLVNSPELLEFLSPINNQIKLIKTTTLDSSSFYTRDDTCKGNTIKLLYTGRINFAKGLKELVNAVAILNEKLNKRTELHIVGWEDRGQNIISLLKNQALELNISDRLFFHGKKKIGEELNSYYRMVDLYVIPSYHEGFPRTIWEALSQSTPVIATHVGGIPYYLNSKENALLIEPKSVDAIVEAVELLINNTELRQQLIKNGLNTAKEVTLENQTKILINAL
jgi:glycosyltransferase involved in cell wall biosynthesis